MRRLPPLPSLRAFEAAARHLSFKRAAAELAVTPTAISHQIRQLEDRLQLRLFERGPRKIGLTPAGQRLYPVLRDGFDAFAEALAALQAPQRSIVTLSATRAVAARWLVPRIARFREGNPGLDLRLHASDEPVDFRRDAVDAAIRYGSGGYAGLAAEELLRDRFAPVCHPKLGLRSVRDLQRHALIHFDWQRVARDTPVWSLWLRRAGVVGVDAQAGLHLSDESHAVQAALAGQGVALLSTALVAEELRSGALMAPFGPTLPGYTHYFVHPQPAAPGVEAVRRWLETVVADLAVGRRASRRASRAAAR
jgi:LysR family glycine cleavage system transcriptional activator